MNNLRLDTRHLPPDLQELVNTIITGVVALASKMNSYSDSNSLGGVLIYLQEGWQEMPEMRPRTKAPKARSLIRPP